MRWICLYQKQENVSKIGSSKTTLSWSKWTKTYLKWERWLININKTSKRSTMTLKRIIKVLVRVRSRSMKFSIRRRKKSTSSLSSLTMRRRSMRRRLRTVRLLSLAYLSICRRQWQDRISYQPQPKLTIWDMISSSSKIRWRMLRPLLLDLANKKSRSKTISRKSSLLKRVFMTKWRMPSKSAQTWRTIWATSLLRLTNWSLTSNVRSRAWIELSSLYRFTRSIYQSRSLFTPWSMTLRRTRSCETRFIIGSTISRRSLFKTSHRSTLSSSISSPRELRAITSISSRIACKFAPTSTWILSRDAWLCNEMPSSEPM